MSLDFGNDLYLSLIKNKPLQEKCHICHTDCYAILEFGKHCGTIPGCALWRESSSIDDEMNTLNFGLSLGAGVSFNQIHFDLRYEIGLANILDLDEDVDDFFNFDFSVTTSGLLLTSGYAF